MQNKLIAELSAALDKIVPKQRQPIVEAATAVLYHFTKLRNVPPMLQNKELLLTAGVGRNDTEVANNKKGKWWYLSTTRSKAGDYTVHGPYSTGVVLVLNGNWFNQKYSAHPIDYWERMWLSTHNVDGIGKSSQRYREAEDRIQSPTPNIPLPDPITDAITELHILWDETKAKVWGMEQFDREKPYLRKTLLVAKQNNIPTFVYGNKNDWLLQNKAKALPLSDLISTLSGEPPNKKMWKSDRDDFEKWRELYFKSKYKDLSKDAKSLAYSVKYHNDMWRQLEADIHNEKRNHNPNLEKLLAIFSKLHVTSPKEFIEVMKKKWTEESVYEGLIAKFNEDVNYDAANGKGAVPWNQEVDYMGMQVMMKPSMFLKLAHDIGKPSDSLEFLKNHIKSGNAIGPPFLSIDLKDDESGKINPIQDTAKVSGHEGRHRALAIMELYGDIPMLVHLFFPQYRARELTPDIKQQLNSNLISQRGVPLTGPFWKEV
jgi:hypothetical protein